MSEELAPAVEAAPDAPPESVEPAADPSPVKDADKRDRDVDAIQRRIDELTFHRREAERREAAKDRQIEALIQSLGKAEPKAEPKPKSLADFGYDEVKYAAHLRSEVDREAESKAKQFAEKAIQEQRLAQRREKFNERLDAFRKEAPDFDQVWTDNTPISEAMGEVLMESDESAALAYYLGKNPTIAQKIYQMSPAQAGRELGKIEDRLIAERKKVEEAKKTVSDAPPPAPKIDGSEPAISVSAADPASDKMSDAEWMKRREREVRKKRTS